MTAELVYKNYAFTLASEKVAGPTNPFGAGLNFRYNPPGDSVHGELLRGYMSTREVDLIDDQVVKGAFQKTIQSRVVDWTAKYGAPYIKILRDHEKLAGILHHMVEDDIGVWVEFWALNTKIGRDFHTEVKSGAINQMSFGFYPLQTKDVTVGSKTIRQILEVDVIEGSGVLWPCNEATTLRSRLLAEKASLGANMPWDVFCEKALAACDKQVYSGNKLSPTGHKATQMLVAGLCKVLSCCGECEPDDEPMDDKAVTVEGVFELPQQQPDDKVSTADTGIEEKTTDDAQASDASEGLDTDNNVSSEHETTDPTVDTKSDLVIAPVLKSFQESCELLAQIEAAIKGAKGNE